MQNGEADGSGIQEFTVYTTSNDADRLDDTVAVMARTNNQPGNQRPLVTFDLDVIDLNKLPEITRGIIQLYGEDGALQEAEVDAIPEGRIGRVTLEADRSPRDVPDSEVLTLTYSHGAGSTADPQDYSLIPLNEVKFTGTTATFDVDVDADEDIGVEELVLMATLDPKGTTPVGPFALDAIPFTDTTGTQISAKTYADIEKARDDARTMGAGDNGLWEPEETLTLMAADLFDYADTANVVLGSVSVEDPVHPQRRRRQRHGDDYGEWGWNEPDQHHRNRGRPVVPRGHADHFHRGHGQVPDLGRPARDHREGRRAGGGRRGCHEGGGGPRRTGFGSRRRTAPWR